MALNPAHKIISKLGGERAVANVLGLNESGVYRWSYPRERGGTDGRIPARHIPRLLTHANEVGEVLRLEEFFEEPSPSDERNGHERAYK